MINISSCTDIADRMNEVQGKIFEIMSDVCSVLENRGIDYYLSYGTALGAVRHSGFIPWDDDADIAIARRDVPRFMEAMEEFLDKGKYYLQHPNTGDYQLHLIKVKMHGTTYMETLYKNADIHHGVFLDVFILEDHPDGLLGRLYSTIVFPYSMTSYMYYKSGNRVIKKVIKSLRKVTDRFLDAFFIDMDSEKVSIRAYDFKESILPRKYFGNPCTMSFEGRSFQMPEMYDKYLTAVYGDYMKIPEESDRKTHDLCACDMNQGLR